MTIENEINAVADLEAGKKLVKEWKGVSDHNNLFNHLVLTCYDEFGEAVANTPDWEEHQKLTAEVKINGVPVPAEVFEAVMVKFVEGKFKELEQACKVEDFNQRLRDELKQHLTGKFELMEEILVDTMNSLDSVKQSTDLLVDKTFGE